MQLDRLLSRIRAALQDYASEFEQRALAAEYAEWCAKTARRLEQVVPLIRGGQDYAALQIAEAPPPVLDLVRQLAFAEAEQWRAYCIRRGLPAGEPFDERQVELVNHLYGRKIGETHPLYRDYRQAIRTRQEDKALRVLQSIRRVNPDDANAHAEFARLSRKVIERKRGELAAAFAHRDTGRTLTLLDELEADGWTPGDQDALGQQAARWRAEQQTLAVRDRALALAEELGRLRAANQWEATLPLLAEWDELRDQFSFALSPEIELTAGEIRAWAGELLAARNREEEWQRLARETTARLVEFTRVPFPRLTNRILTAQVDELRARATELSANHDATDLSERVVQEASQRETLLRRRRKLRAALAAAAALLAAAVIGLAYRGHARARARAAQLRDVQVLLDQSAYGQLSSTLDLIDKEYPELSTDPHSAALLAKAHAVLADVQAEQARFVSDLGQLDRAAAAPNPTPAQLAALLAGLAELDEEAVQLGPQGAAAAHAELADRREEWTQTLSGLQEQRADRLADIATRLDQLYASVHSPPPTVAGAQAVGQQAQSILAEAAAIAPDPQHASVDEKNARARLEAVAERIALLQSSAQDALAAGPQLAQARTLADYLDPLQRLALNPLDGEPAVAAAHSLAGQMPDWRATAQRILLPGQPDLWAFLGTVGDARLQPAEDDQTEDIAFARLVTSDVLANTYRADYIRYQDGVPGNATTVFLAGPLNQEDNKWQNNEEVRQQANVINPDGTTTTRSARVVRFANRNPDGDMFINAVLSPESRLVGRLRQAYDSRAGTIREPLLRVLDDVRADAAASALLKAYLQQEILQIMHNRPNDWGLSFSPSAQADARDLTVLTGGDLQPGDWLFPANPKLVVQLNGYYVRTAPHHYYDEAAGSLRQLVALRATPLTFAGYVDLNQQPQVETAPPATAGLWGVDATGVWRVLYQMNRAQAVATLPAPPPARLTPLLFLPDSAPPATTLVSSPAPPAPPSP
jgi:hypothetical protein